MKRIPLVFPLENDELLYSWVYRLAKTNLYPTRFDFERSFFKGQAIHLYGFGFSRGLLISSIYNLRQSEVFLNHTLYPFFAIFYSKEKQELILQVQRYGYETGSPIESFRANGQDIKFCPECLKEEKRVFLKRAHQLPGVTVCHKHHCKLEILKRDTKREEMNKLQGRQFVKDSSYIATEKEIHYATFMKDILDSAFDMDKEDLNLMIKKRLKDLNILTKKDIKDFFQERDLNLSDFSINSLSKSLNQLSEENLIKILPPLFDNISTFRDVYNEVVKHTYNEDLIAKLNSEGYELIGPYRKNLLEICHKDCGQSFLITEHGLSMGFRCPSCIKLSREEIYEKLFSSKGDEFTLLTPYKGAKEKILVKHSCGNTFETMPNRFYYNDNGCPFCKVKLPLNKAQERVNAIDPTYEVLEYKTRDTPATFLHKTCGYKIKRRYADFLRKGMVCPHCKKQKVMDKTDDYKKEVASLVGTDYEVVSPYLGDRQPIKIRHNICGLVTEYERASYFTNGDKGQRCPLCYGNISDDNFKTFVSARSFGTYTVVDFLPNKEIELLNTTTNQTLILKKSVILQELERPTESKILVCKKDETIKRPISVGGNFFLQLKKTFKNNPFKLDDVVILGFSNSRATKMLNRLMKLGLVKASGKSFTIVEDTENANDELNNDIKNELKTDNDAVVDNSEKQ